MIFAPSALDGVLKVEMSPVRDERGFFARTFCADEFSSHGLPGHFEQSSLSCNDLAGTLRGLHFQAEPNAEAKFVRCVRGAVFDVVVDLRPRSPSFRRWIGETLSAENGVALYVPPGFAHGFQTLENHSDVLYQITPAHRPGHGAGVRWDDPAFDIAWPMRPTAISDRDASYADFHP